SRTMPPHGQKFTESCARMIPGAGDPGHAGPARPRPLVVAHRGSSHAHPEHTLAAYLGAIEEGADGLECDVRLTSDGHPVCVHDRRVGRTSNGRGVVSARSLAGLSALDFGSWRPDLPDSADDLVRPDRDEDRQPVLTLERLVEVVVDAPRPVRLFV